MSVMRRVKFASAIGYFRALFRQLAKYSAHSMAPAMHDAVGSPSSSTSHR